MTTIRVGIFILVAFSVLSHGAVEPWSIGILEIGASLLWLIWGICTIRQGAIEIRWNWLYWPLLVLGGLGTLQLLCGLSAYPYATKSELLRAAAYFLLFFLTVESFHTEGEWKQFVWFLASLSFLVSLLAIIQHFTFNGKLYWFRVLPQGVTPFGPFVNPNHFAGFIELTAPFGLAMLLCGAVRRDKLPLVILLTVLPIGTLILSASRAGITSFLFEFLLLILLTWSKERQAGQLVMAGVLALIIAFLAVWLGLGWTVERFEHLGHGDISGNRRVSLFTDTWQIFRHHPWTGTGLGTLQAVYPSYESYYDGLVVDHAHDDYLELLSDAGLIGGACMVDFVALLVAGGLRNLRAAKNRVSRAIYCASLVACAGLLLHSLVDFNLHIPSNALLFLLLAAMATCSAAESGPSYPQADLF